MNQVITLPQQLGPVLKAARKAAGLTQATLARKLGVSQSRVSDMETDPRSISLEQFLQLLQLLKLEMTLQTKQALSPGSSRKSSSSAW